MSYKPGTLVPGSWQGDYDDETEIYTIKDDQGKVTSFELWTAGQDYWLETAKICETTVK